MVHFQAWIYPQPEQKPFQLEWDDLMDASRNDKPYNEEKRGACRADHHLRPDAEPPA
jgi:hypothetical protein